MTTVPNIILVFLLALATGYLTFLTTKGGLTDNRFSNPIKRLTKRGKTVFCILLFISFVLIWQELNNQANNDKKDDLLKKEKDQRDSTITAGIRSGVESNRRRLFDDISIAFKKQELRLDTVKKDIKKMRDSPNNIVNNYSQPDPVFLIDSDGVSFISKDNFEAKYKIAFKSYDAGSTNFDLECFVLIEYSDGTYDLSNINFFPLNLQIPKNGKWETSFNSIVINPIKQINFYLTGKYTTLDGLKTYNISNIYAYNLKTNNVDILLGKERTKIIQIIQKGLQTN